MNEDEEIWWVVRVFDSISETYTTLSRYGRLDDIVHEIENDGLWEYVSAEPEE